MMERSYLLTVLFSVVLVSFFACGGGGKEGEKKSDAEKEAERRKELMENVGVAKSPEEKGEEIVKASFKALSGALKKKVQEGGIEEALDYCSVHALSLTDSLSEVHGAKISRVTDQPRNPVNRLSKEDSSVFERFRAQWKQSGEATPHLRIEAGKELYYSAIGIEKELCLNCHGKKGVDIQEEHFQKIRERYPEGKAIGYEMGELRGMWRVELVDR